MLNKFSRWVKRNGGKNYGSGIDLIKVKKFSKADIIKSLNIDLDNPIVYLLNILLQQSLKNLFHKLSQV